MKKLMLGLMIAFAVTAARAEVKTNVQIGDLIYSLDTESKTATITGYEGSPATVDVSEVEYDGQKYTVTSVGNGAFQGCSSLTSVSLPSATTIGMFAFYGCSSLTSVSLPSATTIADNAFGDIHVESEGWWGEFGIFAPLSTVCVNVAMKSAIETNGSRKYGITGSAAITYFDALPYPVVKNAGFEISAIPLKSGDTVLDEDEYNRSCGMWNVTPKTAPQVVQEGEIAVTKESLQAAKAEAVSIADGVVSLGVTVNTNGNFTAEAKSWAPVELKSENVEVKDGKIVISIPVDSQSGFMILQSGDAKVGAGNAD